MFKKIPSHVFVTSGRGENAYDLPLQTRMGTEFLILLIAMMTYLLLLSAAGSVSLGSLAKHWTSGLENSMTIEIPSGDVAKSHAESLVNALQQQSYVDAARVLEQADMQKLLEPWLGDQKTLLDDLPLPVLVSVELKERDTRSLDAIKGLARRLAPEAIVDAHEDWLNDLLKLTTGLRLTAAAVFMLILVVTAFVIDGAVRSRMAIHQRELELLHIMGASDKYITGQFVRYIFAQCGKGLILGLGAGLVTMVGFLVIAFRSSGTMPQLALSGPEWLIFMVVPPLLMAVSLLAARRTTLHVLRDMP